jgi:hypothetical protein
VTPGLGAYRARLGIYPDALHRREVYDETPVAHPVAGYGVSSAAHCNHQFVLAGKVHRGDHVGDARAAGDQRWVPVDHAVKDGAPGIVSIVATPDQLAAKVRS